MVVDRLGVERLASPRFLLELFDLVGVDGPLVDLIGSGGYDLEWLVRPGRAAIFLWSTGGVGAKTQLIPVRGPCFEE